MSDKAVLLLFFLATLKNKMSGKGSTEYDVIPFGEGGDPHLNQKTLDGLCSTVQVSGEDILKCRPRCEGGLCVSFDDDSESNGANSQCTISFLGKTCNSCEVCAQGEKVSIAFDCSNRICGGNVGLTCQGEALSIDCPGHSSPETDPTETSATSKPDIDAITIGAFVGGAVLIMVALTLLLIVINMRRRRQNNASSEPNTVPKVIRSDDSSVSSVSDEEDNGDVENGYVESSVPEK